MIGICSESFVWIAHFLFTISRVRPKLNLKKLIVENKYLSKGKDFEIQPRRIEFRMEETNKHGSLFINILVKKMIIEWYFVLLLSCFIYIISEVRVSYSEYPNICLFIFLFFIIIFNELNKNIKKMSTKENSKIIIIRYMRMHI
jgi:hypothetical protein